MSRDGLTRSWCWSSYGKKTTTKKTFPSGSCNDLLLSYLLTYCGFGQFSRTYYCILVSLIERRRLQKHSPFSHFFLLFSPFRRWTSGWSDGGDRRVQVPVAKAVCGRVRLRWPRHPARHRVSHLQHLQWQRPVSSLRLNENKCVLYHLIPRLWSINLNYCRYTHYSCNYKSIYRLISWFYMILIWIYLASGFLVCRNEWHKSFHFFQIFLDKILNRFIKK